MASSDRFGYEWDKYDFMLPQYEEQFLKWIHPLTKEDFKGTVVMDAGCGMGRNSYWPLTYGARTVIAFDRDDRSLNAARENLKNFDNVQIAFGDIKTYRSPEPVDIAFSIGVVHHLRQPDVALRNLAASVKPGGKLLMWVYGYEGNEWIVRYINPIRKLITSKLPESVVHFLTYFCSVPLFVFLKLFPQRRPYLKQLKGFTFKHIHSIAFDQLIPEVANYWTKEEARKLFTDIPELTDVSIYPANVLSWTVIGTKR